jgi:diguanylate cyclase (GGDEF)-like protein/PAS domain S-box-containing protein
VTEPAPLRGVPAAAESPPAGYAGRTRYTQLEYDALLANLSIGIAFTRERRFFLCNARFAGMLGYGPDELVGQSGEVICASPQSHAALAEVAGPLIGQGMQLDVEWELKRKDGSTFVARMIAKALDAANPQQGTVWIVEDLTDKRRQADEVARLAREQEAILATASIGIVFIKDRRIVRCNRRYEEMYGYGPGELEGKPTAVLYTDLSEHAKAGAVYETLARGETSRRVELRRRKDGATFRIRAEGRAVDPQDPHQGSVWMVEDLTQEAANARARHLADHDPLTGLPNRRLLEDRLTQALALSYRNRKQTAVMFVDLDRFKMINDSLGHAVGDLLLKEVARRLVKQLRVGDTICRIGGDEFVVVLPEIKRSEDAANVAHKVLEQLSQPVVLEERELSVTPSIGIAVFPDDGRDAETLIRNSDAAMYHAKELGRANYQFFTAEMNQAASRRLALEADLRRALGKDELRVYYQPIVEARSGRVAAHEALVRWQHPERGLVPPEDFIPLAEETGMILKLGEWVLRQACRWATFIGVERGLPVSVNLSSRQFNDPRLAHTIAAVLRETGLPARLLELEITEATAMQRTDVTLATLNRLKALGVSLAIDDFGTGYSSLPYLKRFPVDKLKIDRALTGDLPGDADQRSVVAAVVALAHALALQVVAEGVESEAQRAFLQACGCDLIQGQLTGGPLDADSAAKDFL